MNQDNTNVLDFAEGGKPPLPSGLNVLTILTFIGCAVAFIFSIYSYFSAEKSYSDMIAMQGRDDIPAYAKAMLKPEMVEMSRKAMENKLPLLILNITGFALCLYGALQMRKLKKQGYGIWLIGEVLPLVGGVFFLGFGMFSGIYLIGILFPILFIILYTVQRKHLIY